MTTKDTIQYLIKKDSNISSIAELERKLDIANGTINKWIGTTLPATKSLTKVADYFDVSTDYLLGRESKSDSHSVDLADNESFLFYDGRQITPEERALITAIIETHRKNKV